MKKRTKFEGLDKSVDNYEVGLFPLIRGAHSPHTYTPQSHENLLRSFSQMKAAKSRSKNYKHETQKLKSELKRLNEEVRQKYEELETLKSQLSSVNSELTNKSEALDYGTGVNESVMESGCSILKTRKADVNEAEIELENSIPMTRDTLSRHFEEMMRRYHRAFVDKNRQIQSLQEKLARYKNHEQWHPQETQELRRDEDLMETKTHRQRNLQEIWLWSNPSVKGKQTNAVAQDMFTTDESIEKTELKNSPQHQRIPLSGSHPAVEAERLRRTEAALQVFKRDVDLVKTQLQNSPLDEQRFPCSSSRERVVVEELRRRQRFCAVADLEAMGKRFFQRLEFEEKLDKLHWELESRRNLECEPTCTYHQEFQMLEITRNNLLKALQDLRAASTHRQPQQQQQQQLQDPISISTIHTLYRGSPNIAESNITVRNTTSELPDK